MKKFLFLLTVLVCLVLSSGVLAEGIPNHYCLVDDYGCYVMDEENHSSYLMFWSEDGRRAVMGELTAPYEQVVAKPGQDAVVKGNLLPLLAPKAAAAGCGEPEFVAAYHSFFTDETVLQRWRGYACDLDAMIEKFCDDPGLYQQPGADWISEFDRFCAS